MRIEFENKFTDILAFTTLHQLRDWLPHALYTLFAIYIFYADFAYAEKGTRGSIFVDAATKALLWYVLLWTIQMLFNVVYLYAIKSKSVLTTHVVEINEDAFYEETKYNKSYFLWEGIVKALKVPGYIAVYVTPHLAVIIPNRSFNSPEDRMTFYNALVNKLEMAKAKRN